jgi:uroporphyrin-III C-methyltransferase / precorrin-2 dehydrogenase / sirohydrochlorin ferrochelatase
MSAVELLPLHLSLAGRRVLVAGGGPVAWRKTASCLAAGARISVVAPHACEDVVDAAGRGEIEWIQREVEAGDLDGCWLVFAATGDADVDAELELLSDARRIFCVRADKARSVGGSRSPAVLRRDDLVISVSTAGVGAADPRRAAAVRTAIGTALDEGTLPLRRQRPAGGHVTLVGGGPGDVDLLTLRGRRALAAADVVVADRLGPRDVLSELSPSVLILEVGKAPGRHPVPQDEINRLLVEHARAGRHVVRLKGGDPYVFGRGGEEVAACEEAGVSVSVVPGISSAFAVPLSAGIPVTYRKLARQVTVLAGHDSGGPIDADWISLARGDGTLVILMGVRSLAHISAALLRCGMKQETPVAIIENGCTPEQRVTTALLPEIAAVAEERGVRSPAVIVIGDVARFARV